MRVRETFTTPYDQFADREGQRFTLLWTTEEADADHDAEVLPMYSIEFEDGETIEAWPEEVLWIDGDGYLIPVGGFTEEDWDLGLP